MGYLVDKRRSMKETWPGGGGNDNKQDNLLLANNAADKESHWMAITLNRCPACTRRSISLQPPKPPP